MCANDLDMIAHSQTFMCANDLDIAHSPDVVALSHTMVPCGNGTVVSNKNCE